MSQMASSPGKQRQAPVTRFFGYYPGTVALVTVATENERNVMSAGWHTALSITPPLYGVAVAKARYTHHLILEAKGFAVNFLPFERAEAIAAAGSVSLHDGRDKFTRFGLQTDAPLTASAPILQDAYLAYECKLQQVLPTGDHDFFVGEVVALHHDPEAFDARWLLDSNKVRAAIYYGRAEYGAFGEVPRVAFAPERFR